MSRTIRQRIAAAANRMGREAEKFTPWYRDMARAETLRANPPARARVEVLGLDNLGCPIGRLVWDPIKSAADTSFWTAAANADLGDLAGDAPNTAATIRMMQARLAAERARGDQ